jgi:hypothetical protein
MSYARIFKIFAAAIAVATPASAYQIGSHSKVAPLYDLHESFTAAARRCLDPTGARPIDCSRFVEEASRASVKRQAPPANTEEYGSRWPDDPTRMLDRTLSQIRIGLQLHTDCQRALRGDRSIDVVGLLCSGHYGRLQFIHAQAREEDGGDAALTRRNILDWADFAYRAATDREFRSTPFCNALPPRSSDGRGLREALTFSDQAWCTARRVRVLGVTVRRYEPWTVRTLFALQCSNPLSERRCSERIDEYGDESARIAAIGALLHLVQDSYSQSHVARVPEGERTPGPRGPFLPGVVCRAPAAYYDYEIQNNGQANDNGQIVDDPHGAADLPPRLHESCGNPLRQVDDIVTASAAVLYFTRRDREPDAAGFRRYLENCVFPDAAALSRRRAGQRCFEVPPLS